MRFLVLHDTDWVNKRMKYIKEYFPMCTFSVQKINIEPKYEYRYSTGRDKKKIKEKLVDDAYIESFIGGYDGVIMVSKFSITVRANHNWTGSKSLIQIKAKEKHGVRWKKDIFWKVEDTLSKDRFMDHFEYCMVHEIGHALAKFYRKIDGLHTNIMIKRFHEYMASLVSKLAPKSNKRIISIYPATKGEWRKTQGFGANSVCVDNNTGKILGCQSKNAISVYKYLGLKGHNGIDFACPVGWKMYFNVKTPKDITWTCWNYEDMYGKKCVIVSDEPVPLGGGKSDYIGMVYLHIGKHKVRNGSKIKFGDYFALTGNTGYYTTAPHTHEAMKRTNEFGFALDTDNGYNGAINHEKYYLQKL